MALLIPPAVFKQLAVMPRADAERLLNRLERIAEAPGGHHVALAGTIGSYRVRQGNWRAVFSIEDGDVILDRVGHRREVYR
jgi:mRNA interferase RelE/StbE